MTNPDHQIWEGILAHVHKQQPALCRNWFASLEPLGIREGSLVLRAPTPLQRDYLRRQCVDAFNDAAQSVTGSLVAVRFLAPGDDIPGERDYARDEPDGRESNRVSGAPTTARDAVRGFPGRDHDRLVHTGAAAFGTSDIAGAPPSNVARDLPGRAAEPVRRSRRFVHYASESELATRPGTLCLNPDYGFENFVVGPGNRLAHAAAVAVANEPATSYNPYFVHGGVGLGKTHLLQAVCITIQQRIPDAVIHFVSCDNFISDFISAVQAGKMSEFRHRFRDVDLLVIDDIHFLSTRDRTQEEFFHTFNSLYQSGKQIVLSSDAKPEEIPDLEDRLVSRFKWGLVTEIEAPCYETRVAILQTKARLRGIEMPEDVASFVADRVNTNIRELEGAIGNLQLHSSVENTPITLELAKKVYGETDPEASLRTPSIDEIIVVVCEFFGCKRSELIGKRRHQSISLPRQMCMKLARDHTRHSLEEIGGHFGGRDHTTVLHAVRAVRERCETDPKIAKIYRELEERLGLTPS